LHDCFEARVAAQRIKKRIGFDKLQVGGAAIADALLEPV